MSKIVNQFYDSDEEIAFGPPTLKEVKKELTKTPRKVKRRQSDSLMSYYFTPCSSFCEKEEENPDKVNTSTTTSAYFTPNDSLNKKEGFLENLARVIDSDIEIHEKMTPEKQIDNTLRHLLESNTCRESKLLDGIQQTLVDNTLWQDPGYEGEIENNEVSTCTIDDTDDEADIIVISDDDSSHSYHEEPDLSVLEISVKMEEKSLGESMSSKNSSRYDSQRERSYSEEEVENSIDRRQFLDLDESRTSGRSENLESSGTHEDSIHTSRFSDINSQDETDALKFLNAPHDKYAISGVTPLEISAHASTSFIKPVCESIESEPSESQSTSFIKPVCGSGESESSESQIFNFNDTLEEMDMAFKEGLNYHMPNEDSQTSVPPSPASSSHIPKMASKENLNYLRPEEDSQTSSSHIPVYKKQNKFDYITSPVAEYIKKKSPTHEYFKAPLHPVKTKIATPNPKYKNIVSPVSVYMKNSPASCLKRNVTVRTVLNLKSTGSAPVSKANKENVALPEVVYRPAQKVVASVEKDVVLPKSIQKLVHEPVIAKHQARIQINGPRDVQRKLIQADLTLADSTIQEEDVSFHVAKQVFIK